MTEPILRDVFPNWAEGEGIFDKIMELTEMPWSDDDTVDSTTLDLAYFGNYAGSRFCAPVVKHLLEDGVLSDSARETLARIIVAKYKIPWSRLWLTNELSYSPINNYDMTETRNLSRNITHREVEDTDVTHTGTDTLQHGKIETTQHGKTTEELDSKYGFNTQDDGARPSDLAEVTEGGSTTQTNSGSDINTKNLSDSTDSTVDKTGAEQEAETTHKIGNIGVTTNQKLIQEERSLWIWNYFNQVFKDITTELTLCVFDPCRV